MRRLSTAVVAGGVVSPAGTAETPELAEMVTNPAAWAGEPGTAPAPVAEAAPEVESALVEPETPKPARKRAAKKPSED